MVTLDQIKSCHIPDLCIQDLPVTYRIRSHGNNRFLLFSTYKNPLILKDTKNEDKWQRKFFFVKRDSIAKGFDLTVKWLTSESEQRIKDIYRLPESERTFSLSFVKKEPSSKETTSSKPTSSKAVAIPKPSPATKTHASSARKRKEMDTPATSETFPYENHGFNEASGLMTSFLNQVKISILYSAHIC
ncbi:hypothetical protein Hanom_Chr09g00806191 [Helianthus anomalus]